MRATTLPGPGISFSIVCYLVLPIQRCAETRGFPEPISYKTSRLATTTAPPNAAFLNYYFSDWMIISIWRSGGSGPQQRPSLRPGDATVATHEAKGAAVEL